MDDTALVRHGHRARQGLDELRRAARTYGALGDPLIEAAAVNKFQREERSAFVFAGLVDLHDIGM